MQSHTTDSSLNLLVRTTRGTGEPFDGVTEVWWPSERTLLTALATPQGQLANQRLIEDEKNFIDLSRSSYFMTREHVFLG